MSGLILIVRSIRSLKLITPRYWTQVHDWKLTSGKLNSGKRKKRMSRVTATNEGFFSYGSIAMANTSADMVDEKQKLLPFTTIDVMGTDKEAVHKHRPRRHFSLHLKSLMVSLPIFLGLFIGVIMVATFIVAIVSQPTCFTNHSSTGGGGSAPCRPLDFSHHIPTISEAGGYYPAAIIFSYGLNTFACFLFIVLAVEFAVLQRWFNMVDASKNKNNSSKRSNISKSLIRNLFALAYWIVVIISCVCLGLLSCISLFLYTNAHRAVAFAYFVAILLTSTFILGADLYVLWNKRHIVRGKSAATASSVLSEYADSTEVETNGTCVVEQQDYRKTPLLSLRVVSWRLATWLSALLSLVGLCVMFLFTVVDGKSEYYYKMTNGAMSITEYTFVLSTNLFMMSLSSDFYHFHISLSVKQAAN